MRVKVDTVFDMLDAGEYLTLELEGEEFEVSASLNIEDTHQLIADLQKNVMKLIKVNKERERVDKKYKLFFKKEDA